MSDPKTRAEWQEAVDFADWGLRLASARLYGLIIGGVIVNESRAMEVLARGRALGIRPAPDCFERLTREYLAWQAERKRAGAKGKR